MLGKCCEPSLHSEHSSQSQSEHGQLQVSCVSEEERSSGALRVNAEPMEVTHTPQRNSHQQVGP